MLNILLDYYPLLFAGFITTLKLLVLVSCVGVVLGILLGAIGARDKFVGRSLETAKFMTRIIPALVLLFWFHYPLQTMLGVVIEPFWTAVLVLGLINVVSVAYLVHSEIKLLPRKHIESAKALGMSGPEIKRHIEVPMVFKRSFPEILLMQAMMLEYTLFASLISVSELFRVAQNINSLVYDPVSVYSLLILFFVLVLGPLHIFIIRFRKNNTFEYA